MQQKQKSIYLTKTRGTKTTPRSNCTKCTFYAFSTHKRHHFLKIIERRNRASRLENKLQPIHPSWIRHQLENGFRINWKQIVLEKHWLFASNDPIHFFIHTRSLNLIFPEQKGAWQVINWLFHHNHLLKKGK